MRIRIVLLSCMFALGLFALPGSIPAGELLWPVDCVPGDSVCSGYIGYPDIDGDGKAFDCSSPGYTGHQGTDIPLTAWGAMDSGVSVFAALDGEVLWVFDGKYDRCPDSSEPDCQAPPNDWFVPGQSNGFRVCTDIGNYCGTGGYGCFWCFDGGNVVVIRHTGINGVFATRYDHLKKNSILVSPGDFVSEGQKIAEVGSAGHSTGPHLHFEVWSKGFYKLGDPWAGACGPNFDYSLWQNIPPWSSPISSTLSVITSGTGSGTVTSSPSGINCASTCDAAYTNGTPVTLTATPDSGSTFTGWSGSCSGTGTCTVSINSDTAVTANFDTATYTLSATIQGLGTVAGTGLACEGGSCSGNYPYNTTVSLTATPDAGAGSILWTGCDEASETSCYVTMTSDRNVTATFACPYAISPASKSFTYKGGSAAIKITAEEATTCANPDIAVSDTWILAKLTSFKKNKGSVKITTAANTTSSLRTGTATIAGKSFNITQAGAPCTLSISPTRNTFSSSAASASFAVAAPAGCAWTAEVDSGSAAWLTISSGSTGNGNGVVTYDALQNTATKQRKGKIKVHLAKTPAKSKTFSLAQGKPN